MSPKMKKSMKASHTNVIPRGFGAYDESTDHSDIRCHICGAQSFTSWAAIGTHLSKTHDVDVGASCIGTNILLDMGVEISAEEVAHVSIDPASEKHFYCIKCGDDRFAKISAAKHFTVRHPEVCDWSSWFVMKDGAIIRNSTGSPLLLTSAMHRHRDAVANEILVTVGVEISEEEVAHVSIDPTSETHFYCRKCVNPAGKPLRLSKTSAAVHFKRKHQEAWDPTWSTWFVVKDGGIIRNYTGTQLLLTNAMKRHRDAAANRSNVSEPDGTDIDAGTEPSGGSCPEKSAFESHIDCMFSVDTAPSQARVHISIPGAESAEMCVVPRSVATELMSTGFLEIFDGGRFEWTSDVQVDMQRAVLLEAMPDGPMKRVLETRFHAASAVVAPMRNDRMHSIADTTTPVQGNAPPVPHAATTDLTTVINELKALIAGQVSGAPRSALQTLVINEEFATWVAPVKWQTQHRKKFPFDEIVFVHPGFNKFMEVRRLKPNTREIYMRGLARALTMVKAVDGSDVDCDNILLNIFRSELFQKLQELPILSDTYSPTRQTVLALCHFAVMSKLRLQAEGDGNGAQMIDQVINGHLMPWSKRCNAGQKEASMKKYNDDALLIEKYHKPYKWKEIALSQYLDLMTIHSAVCRDATHQLTPTLLFKATACVITALYTNAPPTRSMEWQSLLDSTITEFLAVEDLDWFAFSNYKTYKVYGKGGKWIHASNRRAIVIYRELLNTKPEFRAGVSPEDLHFFQKQTISVHSCLKSTSIAEKLDPPLRVNLQRKVWAVWAKLNKTSSHKGVEGAEDLFAKVARSDKHKTSTADNIYAAITPEEDAKLSKHCFLRLMGEPVNFPSVRTWEKSGRSIQYVLARIHGCDTNVACEGGEEEEESVDSNDDWKQTMAQVTQDDGAEDEANDWADVLTSDTHAEEHATVDGRDPPLLGRKMSPPDCNGRATNLLGAKAKSAPVAEGRADPYGGVRIEARAKANVKARSTRNPDLDKTVEPGSVCGTDARTEGWLAPEGGQQLETTIADAYNTPAESVNESDGAKEVKKKKKKKDKKDKKTCSHTKAGSSSALETNTLHKVKTKDKGRKRKDDIITHGADVGSSVGCHAAVDDQISETTRRLILMHTMNARGIGLMDGEKEYIVKMLYNIQRNRADYVPGKVEIESIIEGGLCSRELDAGISSKRAYHEKVRNFIRQFVKLVVGDCGSNEDE